MLGLLFTVCVKGGFLDPIVYSARMVHRFSDEARAHRGVRVLKSGAEVADGVGFWPQRRSSEYYRRLLSSDVQRQTLKLNPQFQFLYPSEGSATFPLGNDFGWSLSSLSLLLFLTLYIYIYIFMVYMCLCLVFDWKL